MDKLRDGTTKSCGCLAREIAEQQRKVRPLKVVKPKRSANEVRLRAVHTAMMQRCYNTNNSDYATYGGRGIYVVAEWHDTEAFLAWAMPKYRPGLWVERVDNDGPYSPGNCALVSPLRQGRNRRNTLWVMDGPDRKPLSRVAAYMQIPYPKAYRRYSELLAQGLVPNVRHFQATAGMLCSLDL